MENKQIYDKKESWSIIASGKDEDTLYDKAKRSGTPLIYDGKSYIVDIKDAPQEVTESLQDILATLSSNEQHEVTLRWDPSVSDNYHKSLNYAKENIKAPNLSDVKRQDKLTRIDMDIHEAVKYGPPPAEMFHEIDSRIHHSQEDNLGDNSPEKQYLRQKYSWIKNHYKTPPTHFSKEEMYLTPKEIGKHSKDFRFISGRFMRSMMGNHDTVYELHPSGKLNIADVAYPRAHFDDELHPIRRRNKYDELTNLHMDHATNINTQELSHDTKGAISDYTTSSRNLNIELANSHLKKPSLVPPSDTTQLQHISKNLTDGMRTHKPLDKSFTVYAGLSRSSVPTKMATKTEEGHHVHFAPSFLSTSLSPRVAETFAKPKLDAHDDINVDVHDIAEIHIPENYNHGMYVDPLSTNKSEWEYILNKGHAFKAHPKPKYYVNRDGQMMRHWKFDLVPQDHSEGNADLEKR